MNEAEKYSILAQNLNRHSKINRFDTSSEKEAWTLAHSFVDLEESFSTCSNRLFPELLRDDLTEEDVLSVLNALGEEFRHILYHIADPNYYRYLFPVEMRGEAPEVI